MKTKILLYLCLVSLNVMGQQNIPSSEQTTGTLNGHEWVDLGLSVKWATCNVGASNPSDYGNYYAWGETKPKTRYTWDNYFDRIGVPSGNFVTYKRGSKTRIEPDSGHDTARENWGGTWRMPTDEECEELCKKCKWDLIVKNGHECYVITGPNGNSIILPTAGYRYETDTEKEDMEAYYWSSTLRTSYSENGSFLQAWFDSHRINGNPRCYGFSVRPVTK